jgi:hypothetical protein
MADIFNFPNLDEREWRFWEECLRDQFSKLPDGLATIEDCLPAIKTIWEGMFAGVIPITRSLHVSIPAPLTQEQIGAIKPVCDACSQSYVKQLKDERRKHFLMFVAREFDGAYLRRTGIDLNGD